MGQDEQVVIKKKKITSIQLKLLNFILMRIAGIRNFNNILLALKCKKNSYVQGFQKMV